MLVYTLLLLAISIFGSTQCLASSWPEQGFDFGWPNLFNLPITAHCESLNISWFRGSGAGPVPQGPYEIEIYTSAYPNLFVLDAGNGANATVPISFPAGSQYLICMSDPTKISGGCSEVFTVYPSSNTCTNLTAPTPSLQVAVTTSDKRPVSSRDWVAYGTELEFAIGQNATNGSRTIPPYTVSIIPASGTPLNLTSDMDSTARWTVSLDIGRQFFVSIADKSGYIWVGGPLQVSGNCTIPATVPIAHAWLTIPVLLGISFGFLVLGLLLATLCAYVVFRYRRRRASSGDPEKLIRQTDLRNASTSSDADHKLPMKSPTAFTGGDDDRFDHLPDLAVGNASTQSPTRRRLSRLRKSVADSEANQALSSSVANLATGKGTSSNQQRKKRLESDVDARNVGGLDMLPSELDGTARQNTVILGGDGHNTINAASSIHPETALFDVELALSNTMAPNGRLRVPTADPNRYFNYHLSFNDVPREAYTPYDRRVFETDPKVNLCDIIIVIDKSGSMDDDDQVPPQHYPSLFPAHNNRFGATLAAFHEFVMACKLIRRPSPGLDKDTYSCIVFDDSAAVVFEHDERTASDDLLESLMEVRAGGGTSFEQAISTTRLVMESNWAADRHPNRPKNIARIPVIIFLSDGFDNISDRTIRDLCQRGADLGNPPAFYAISFGAQAQEGPLKQMVKIATEEYRRAVPNTIRIPCAYRKTLDEIQVGNTFIKIAESLRPHDVALVNRV